MREPTDGAELGGEGEGVADPAVVQRLLAHPVPGEDEHAVAAVPGCQREHPVDGCDGRLRASPGDQLEEYLGVRVPAKHEAVALQSGPMVCVVVDLTVEHEDPTAVRRGHGLVSRRREVDD